MSFSIVQASFTLAAFVYLLLPLQRLGLRARVLVLATLLALTVLPVGEIAMAAYLRGVIGDLAITTTVFLLGAVVRKALQSRNRPLQSRMEPAAFYALLGLVLYPATLGLSAWDPYRLGFQPELLLIACGIATMVFCLRKHYLAAIAMILATLAFSFDVGGSRNYWDYILDPILAFYSLGVVAAWTARRFRQAPGGAEVRLPGQFAGDR